MLTWRVPDGVTEIGETGLVAFVGLCGVPIFLCISLSGNCCCRSSLVLLNMLEFLFLSFALKFLNQICSTVRYMSVFEAIRSKGCSLGMGS